MASEKWKIHKKFVGILILIILVLCCLVYLANYGFSFPPCSSYEIPLESPSLMKTSDIIFEKQMYFVIKANKETKSFLETCPLNMIEEAVGFIQQDNQPYLTPGYKITPINKGERFKLIRESYLIYRGLNHIDGGNQQNIYLLKDENGKEWYVPSITFLNLKYGNNNEPKWLAGYYNGSERLGDVVVKDVWQCNQGGKLVFCSENY